MRVELVELLNNREICHPSRIVSLYTNFDSNLRIEVIGYPWWLETPTPDFDRKITFYFKGITDGCLDSDIFSTDGSEEDLETFSVWPLSENKCAEGDHCDVYCSSPLSRPLDVYATLHDFLLSNNSPYGPDHFLNFGRSGSLNEFANIASSTSFLLYSGPEALCKIVCDELKKFGTDFNVIKDIGWSTNSNELICIQFSRQHIICQSAYAIFDD